MQNQSLYKKLLQVQQQLNAPKSQYNQFGKYHYRNCEDILAALKPILKKENCTIIIADSLELIGSRYYIRAMVTFIDTETGNSVSSTAYAREEESKKGMDGSQITGSSSSYARKYALNGLFGIDDTKDSDSGNPEENREIALICNVCGNRIRDVKGQNGETMKAIDWVKMHGKKCSACWLKQNKKQEG